MFLYFRPCLKAMCSTSLLGSSIEKARNLPGGFRFCCSLSIPNVLSKSSSRLLASAKLSVWPNNFNPIKIFNPVQASNLLEGMIVSTPSPTRDICTSSFSSVGI